MGLVVGTISQTARVSTVRWNLKEAEGKVSHRRTETTYKAYVERTSLPNKTKSNTTRIPRCKCSGDMRWKLLFLSGEVWQISCDYGFRSNKPHSDVCLNCQKSAEAILDWWIHLLKGWTLRGFGSLKDSREIRQKQTTSQEGCPQKIRLEAEDIEKVLSISTASDNRRNGENAYSSILTERYAQVIHS